MNNRRPNILLIVSEDHGLNLGCYGDRIARTPNLDRLASEGMRFEKAYTTQAVCSPGRASIFTGLYPHQNGQIGLATHFYSMYEDFPNIPSLLKREGYRTGLIGKLHVNPESAFPFDFRWRESEHISFQHRDVQKTAEVARDFMGASDLPFFLMIAYPDAHTPFLRQEVGVPEKPLKAEEVETLASVGVDSLRIRQQTADYYNCLSRLDTGVGMVLSHLSELGKEDNTLVIFTTDHGPQMSRGKFTIYESAIREPLIVRWPGESAEGLVRDQLISHVDVLPTILDAVDVEIPAHVVGESLLPLVRGEDIAWRKYLFAEWTSGAPVTYFPQRSVRDDRYKLIVNFLQNRSNPSAVGYADGKWETGAQRGEIAASDECVRKAYACYENPPYEELYDLETDPNEFEDLSANPELNAVKDRLRNQLYTWQVDTQDGVRIPEVLERLTQVHDTTLAAHYQLGLSRRSRAPYTWDYHEYLRA